MKITKKQQAALDTMDALQEEADELIERLHEIRERQFQAGRGCDVLDQYRVVGTDFSGGKSERMYLGSAKRKAVKRQNANIERLDGTVVARVERLMIYTGMSRDCVGGKTGWTWGYQVYPTLDATEYEKKEIKR